MMLRLLIALALALFALPGMASACHDGPVRATAAHHGMQHQMPDDPAPTAPHACVGCIPPSMWVAAAVTPPPLPASLLRHIAAAPLQLSAAPAPDIPPPRGRG